MDCLGCTLNMTEDNEFEPHLPTTLEADEQI